MAEGSGEALGWNTDASSSNGTLAGPAPDPVLYAIQLWFTPVLVTLGSLGNCLCVIVFFSTKLKKLSSSYYLSALAISDTCALVSVAATWFDLVDIPFFNTEGFCQLFVYMKCVCSFLSVWFVVAFTVERFVAVSYPLQHRGSTRPGGTQSKVTEMLLIVSTVFIALNLPSYFIRLYIFVNDLEATPRDEGAYLRTAILQNYFNVLFDANFGINFVLYCVSGQNFRRALFGMCGLRSRRTDTTVLTVVSEVARAGSLNRGRNVSSFRYIRDQRSCQELMSLAKDHHHEGNGYHADVEKTHL